MDMIIPPLKIKILLESNPLKYRILVRRLAVYMLRTARVRFARLISSAPALTKSREGAAGRRVGGPPG